jgi:uncharacterized phiE125 gp8 family phage protein
MLIEPPDLEPLTRAEAKLLAGLNWADSDPRAALLDGFIRAARAQVERDTGIAMLEQTHRIAIVREAYTQQAVVLPRRPARAVVVDAIDGGAVWDAANYVLEPSSVDPTPARLTLASASSWPTGLQATIVAGFETVEDLHAHAPDLVHAVGLLVAHYATLGRDLASVSPAELVPMGYEEAIAFFRLVVVA